LIRLAWLSDIHLDHADQEAVTRLAKDIQDTCADAVLLGGDIATATALVSDLVGFHRDVGMPIYLVLGNHDFYGGSIAKVRSEISTLCRRNPGIVWLSESEPIALTARTWLIGHDGWGDGGYGAADTSEVVLNDFLYIDELRLSHRSERLAAIAGLGTEAAAHLRRVAGVVPPGASDLLVLTHVPPFAEAAWHDGQPSGPDWLPFFACKATGEVILEVASSRPACTVTVLCGHTHGAGTCRPASNVIVETAAATYGRPALQRVIEAD
jgi:predicted MPP superfamily phosphohydrolase